MEPILVVFIVFGSVGAVAWKFLDGRHSERLAMIEKGVNAGELRGSMPRFRISPLSNLKWGLLFLAVGLGIFVATLLDEQYGWHDSSYPAMIFLFGGASLVVFYAIARRKIREEDN